MRGWLGAGMAAVALLAPARAWADDAKACLTAFEDGQRSAAAGKLIDARKFYDVCSATSCPQLVRNDCLAGRDSVDKAMPTVTFVIRDARNADVDGFAEIDGHAVTTFGRAVPVDPGDHVVKFGSGAEPRRELKIRVAEGEKARLVRLSLHDGSASAEEPGKRSSTGTGWVVLGLGGAVLLTGSVVFVLETSSFFSKRDEIQQRYAAAKCQAGSKDPTCVSLDNDFNTNRDSGTRGMLIGGAIAGVGAVATGIGLYMVLSHRSSTKSATLVPVLGHDVAGAALIGRF